MRVIVTGATGFIGRQVTRALVARGDEVTVFSRHGARAQQVLGGKVRVVDWSPEEAGPWASAMADHDAIVHLAGEPAVGVRYSTAAKKRILDSRVLSIRNLVRGVTDIRRDRRPRAMVSASAVGYYGPRPSDEPLDEQSLPGRDFLAQVCVASEAEAGAAIDVGLRGVAARIGIALGPGGGALEALARPFRYFVGGPIGEGEQVVSWIHIADLVRALLFALDDERLSGPVNVTAPHAVTSRELSEALGGILRRPSWLPAPETALRLALGEGATPLLTGQRVLPTVLERCGFQWQFPKLEPALRAALVDGAAADDEA